MSTKIKMRKHNLCHRCPHNGKGDPACLTCRDPAITAHRGTVSMESLVEIGKEPSVEPADAYYDDDDRDDGDNTMQRNRIDELVLVISTFFSLTAQQFEVVKTLYQDKKTDGYATYRNAAEKLGVDRHEVATRLAEALKACPALATLNLHKSVVRPQWRGADSGGLPVVDTNDIRLPDGEPTDDDIPEY